MTESKLIFLIKNFTTKELTRFNEFVQSPYFNKHEKVIQLLKIIADAAPNFSEKKLSKEVVYKRLFPKETFDYMKLAHIQNYLMDLLEQFLSIDIYRQDSFSPKMDLVKAMGQRQLPDQQEKHLKKLKKDMQAARLRDIQHYQLQYQYHKEADLLYVKKQKRTSNDNLQRKGDFLDKYFIAEKLQISCEMITRQNILNIEYTKGLLDSLLAHLESNAKEYKNEPPIAVYLKIYKLFTEENDDHFEELLELIDRNEQYFSIDELTSLYDYAQNYCIKRINSGKAEFLNKIFLIYQILIEKKIILQNEFIPASMFKNITTVGLRLKEYDWTEQFVKAHYEYLDEKIREDVYNYNLAAIYYSKNEYGKALEMLRFIEFTDVYYALGARAILLKIYFEQEEPDLFHSCVDSFKIFLKRNKLVSKYQYTVHFNLLKYSKRAFNYRSTLGYKKSSVENLNKLKTELQELKDITNKDWLLAQLNKQTYA